ncbi:MAG TPA: Gldg family protein [Candidatus Paceibacterota bacterium]|nr:Gldg family protein [Verrucomicrobiota bacterium]HSA09880.1 Gldg family protein [Candidatus Paceibacterota bacterium]
MNQLPPNLVRRPGKPGAGQQAGVRTLLLFLLFFLLGIAVSAFWFYLTSVRASPGASGQTGIAPAIRLSDSTTAVLSRLNSPLEARFYAVLDPATVPPSMTAFASRVRQLLSAYEQEAGDKIQLTAFDSASQANLIAAAAEGIQVFNLDKGEPCYLGLALALNGRKETLPYLSPDWEPALEPDLTRAIARLLDASRPAGPARPGASVPQAVAPVDTDTIRELKTLLPNLSTVTIEEGTQILREAALKEFAAAATEMETQIKQAEQRLAQAQQGGSDADKQAALRDLQQVQADQSEKLKQIAARSRAQIDALRQIKAGP